MLALSLRPRPEGRVGSQWRNSLHNPQPCAVQRRSHARQNKSNLFKVQTQKTIVREMNLEPRKVARLHLEQQACSHEDALAVHPGNEIYYQPAMHAWPFSSLCSGVCVHRRHTSDRTRTPFHTGNRQLSRRRHMASQSVVQAKVRFSIGSMGIVPTPTLPASMSMVSGCKICRLTAQVTGGPPAPVPWQPNPPALLPHDLQQDKTKRVCFAGSPAKE